MPEELYIQESPYPIFNEVFPPAEDVANLTPEEVTALFAREGLKLLREERNRRISETDWWVLADRTPTQEQLAYRQALRDITNSYASLNDVVWPVKPE